jgi:hypothetical protein
MQACGASELVEPPRFTERRQTPVRHIRSLMPLRISRQCTGKLVMKTHIIAICINNQNSGLLTSTFERHRTARKAMKAYRRSATP